ncbi:hypothetical protein CDD83_10113 [Cordyceps sp. RAO-2017]|nr:hypothetical protein CDD83_10113 [Cordyceps sp. RAO-2017]
MDMGLSTARMRSRLARSLHGYGPEMAPVDQGRPSPLSSGRAWPDPRISGPSQIQIANCNTRAARACLVPVLLERRLSASLTDSGPRWLRVQASQCADGRRCVAASPSREKQGVMDADDGPAAALPSAKRAQADAAPPSGRPWPILRQGSHIAGPSAAGPDALTAATVDRLLNISKTMGCRRLRPAHEAAVGIDGAVVDGDGRPIISTVPVPLSTAAPGKGSCVGNLPRCVFFGTRRNTEGCIARGAAEPVSSPHGPAMLAPENDSAKSRSRIRSCSRAGQRRCLGCQALGRRSPLFPHRPTGRCRCMDARSWDSNGGTCSHEATGGTPFTLGSTKGLPLQDGEGIFEPDDRVARPAERWTRITASGITGRDGLIARGRGDVMDLLSRGQVQIIHCRDLGAWRVGVRDGVVTFRPPSPFWRATPAFCAACCVWPDSCVGGEPALAQGVEQQKEGMGGGLALEARGDEGQGLARHGLDAGPWARKGWEVSPVRGLTTQVTKGVQSVGQSDRPVTGARLEDGGELPGRERTVGGRAQQSA